MMLDRPVPGFVLNDDLYQEYQATRRIPPQRKNILCYAPVTSINFDQSGEMTACCYNRSFVLGRYPHTSIQQAWESGERQQLCTGLRHKDFRYGCERCYEALQARNFSGALSHTYDRFNADISIQGMPSLFIFEISNICNLECLMCGGKWSSAIRKNREQLPEMQNPYDVHFVEQVKAFLPYLKNMRFVGGEPFLVPLYYHIWNAAIDIKPDIEIDIATNGTILDDRVKSILARLKNSAINISIDSFNRKRYEYIRKNASYKKVRENIKYFLQERKLGSICVCPMIQNWQDIPEIIEFCEKHGLSIHFNIVTQALGGNLAGIHEHGVRDYIWNSFTGKETNYRHLKTKIPEFSLRNAPKKLLRKILCYYNTFLFTPTYQKHLNGLKNQIEAWISEE